MNPKISIGDILNQPLFEHGRAFYELFIVLLFSFVPILLAAVAHSLSTQAGYLSTLYETLGGAHLLLYSLASLGTVAAKLWPDSEVGFRQVSMFNIVVLLLASACGVMIGADPTLNSFDGHATFYLSLFVYVACTIMNYFVILYSNMRPPTDLQKSLNESAAEMTAKADARRAERRS